MSAVKSSTISSRTKSLRERFGSKRSYSENFKDPPVPNSPKKDSTGRNVRPSLPIIGVPLPGGVEPVTVPTNLLQQKHGQQQEQLQQQMQHAYQQEQLQQMQHAYQQEQFHQQMQQMQQMHPQEQFPQQFQQMHPQDQFHQQMQQIHQQEQFHLQMQQMRRNVQMNVLSEHFNPFAALPEETYCSALDINSQQGDDPRFPWQRDAAIQCDMSPTGEGYKYARKDSFFMLSRDAANKSQEDQSEANTEKSSTMLTLPSFSNYSTGTPFTMGVENPTQAIGEKFREAYWPNLSICNEEEEPSPIPKPEKGKKKKTSMLQRALSERSRSRRLNAQMAADESKPENNSPQHARQIYSPHHVQTLSTNLESQLSIEGGKEAVGKTLFKEVNFNSAPASRTETPPSDSSPQTPPSSLNFIPGTPPSRKNSRRLKFVRKQTHSAPDSFDNDEEEQQPHPVAIRTPPIITHTGPDSSGNSGGARSQGLGVGYYNFDSMQRLLDLSMTSSSKPEKPTFLLTPGGLAVGKDKSGAYMTLPSPNVQNADEQDGPQNVFKKLSSLEDEESEHEEPDDHAPPASALHRRRALVPPKMLTDGYESSTEEADQHSPNGTSVTSADGSTTPGQSRNNRRRSSIVVIPPMQICPGDLLVYSKVLSQRNTLLDIDGSTQSLTVSEDSSRKGKNTWSLLRLFDRSSRSKSESLCGLEEVLSSLQPSEFIDEHLSKYKGMSWTDFVSLWEGRTRQEHKAFLRSNAKWLNFNNSSSTETSVKLSTSSHLPSLNIPGSFSSSTIGSPTANITGSNTTSGISSLDFSSTARGDDTTASSSSTSSFSHQYSQQGSGTHLDNLGFPSNVDNGCSLPSSASVLDKIEHQIHNIGAMTRSRNELKRREALWDLFQSECMFLYDHLMVLKNVFMEPLKKIQVEGFAMFAEPEVLFGNLDELCCVTYSFCKEFLSLILQKMSGDEIDTTEVLVKLFKKSAKAHALTQAYHRYTLNYINALNYLETLRRQVEFNEFEKWCSRDSRCKKLQLTDLLVSPVQHVMRVPLILKEVEMRTEDLREKHIISNIIESEENSLRELDDKMKWLKNFERLLEIQRSIVWPSVSELDPKAFIPDFLKQPLAKQPCERLIVSPRRQIVLEGSLHLLDSGKPSETFVLLFDDMLLITRRKKGLHKKKSSITENWASTSSKSSSEAGYKYVVYKQPLSLDRFFIHDVSQQDGAANNLKNTFVLVCLNRFQQIVTVHTFQAPNESVKNLWLSKLRDTMDRWKRTLQNTVFRNQRTTSTTSTATPHIGTTTVK